MNDSPDFVDPSCILSRIDNLRELVAIDWARLKGGRNSRAMERRLRVTLVDIEFWTKAFRTLTRAPLKDREMVGAAILARWKSRKDAQQVKSETSAQAKRTDG